VLPQDYLEPARAWFTQCDATPVRTGRPGGFERRTLLRPGMPAPLRRVAAGWVLRRNARLGPAALSGQPYVDWRFTLVRDGGRAR
jgi:hypothetical protein